MEYTPDNNERTASRRRKVIASLVGAAALSYPVGSCAVDYIKAEAQDTFYQIENFDTEEMLKNLQKSVTTTTEP